MKVLLVIVVLLVAAQRLLELRLSRRNERRLRNRGAVEYGRGHYPFMVALHSAWLVFILIEGLVRGPEFDWFWFVVFLAVHATTVVAVGWGIFQGEGYGFVLVPALVIYFFLPRVRAGTRGHAALAVIALIFYVLAFVITL